MGEPRRLPADLIVHGAGELATASGAAAETGAPSGPPRPFAGRAQGEAGVVPGGAVAAFRGRVVAAGPEAEVLAAVELTPDATVVDAEGRLVTPGLVGAHTHLCFAGWRAEEFRMRLEGRDYREPELGRRHSAHCDLRGRPRPSGRARARRPAAVRTRQAVMHGGQPVPPCGGAAPALDRP
ncbi:MAG: hypothetical protein IRZ11_00705 [Clostridia bacterium]|nr:hypothetical protein [Clostridia bacterium]